ncbi:hypothetical protein [Streptococcus thoraltensis]|uniref:hypothetical protein n=1 Tax=Streptococcus thoraltensis TaxID=55085 RepID=UPI000376EEF1|nr:hypothetical protein [Streptococcus thoraltensis]MDY4762296.1 hypothetical protein [Streptococcus thoraltensis]
MDLLNKILFYVILALVINYCSTAINLRKGNTPIGFGSTNPNEKENEVKNDETIDEKVDRLGIKRLPNGDYPLGFFINLEYTDGIEHRYPYNEKFKCEGGWKGNILFIDKIDGYFYSNLPTKGKKIYVDDKNGMFYLEHDYRVILGLHERPDDFSEFGCTPSEEEVDKEMVKLYEESRKQREEIILELETTDILPDSMKQDLYNKLAKAKEEMIEYVKENKSFTNRQKEKYIKIIEEMR